MSNQRILSGMRSTNPRLHLGNYEGALRNWVDLQNQGYQMFCMVADIHALTTMYEEAREVSRNSREIAKDYIAAGIDPSKSAVFIQSHVPEHSELHLLFSMMTPKGWLDRIPTYKEKVRDSVKNTTTPAGLLKASSEHLSHLANLVLQATTSGQNNPFPGYDLSETANLARLQLALASQHAGLPSYLQSSLESLASDVVSLGIELRQREGVLVFGPVFQDRIRVLAESIESLIPDAAGVVYGLLGYPVLQTADILLYRPYGVPVGRDQAPHLEIGNDIAIRFNRLYETEVFKPFKYMIPEDESRAKVPGLDADDAGKLRKMSKSYDNCIYLSDTEDELMAKIKGAFTTPSKMRKTDPGIPEGCAVCQLLKLYSPQWEHQWNEDREGIRGCMQNKKECSEALTEFLRPMRERRAQLDDDTIEDILRDGAKRAREVAGETMAMVRSAMGMF